MIKQSRKARLRWIVPLVLVSGLAGAELAGRALGFGRPLLYRAAASGYEPMPGQSVHRLNNHVTINQLGMRGPDTGATPSLGTKRVLLLGDSVAFGTTMNDDAKTIPALTQTALSPHPIEILNASAGGWALENERRWLGEHGTFGANLVVLEVNQGDLTQGLSPSSMLGKHPNLPNRNPPGALYEIVTRYLAPRLHLTKAAIDPGASAENGTAPEAEIQASIQSIRDIALASGAKFIILYWDMRDPATAAPDRREHLFAWARANNVAIVRPQLAQRPDADKLFIDTAHPNATGNALIAKALAGPILEQLH